MIYSMSHYHIPRDSKFTKTSKMLFPVSSRGALYVGLESRRIANMGAGPCGGEAAYLGTRNFW